MRARSVVLLVSMLGVLGACGTTSSDQRRTSATPSATTSASTAPALDPLSLPRGADARVPVLTDEVIRTPKGPITLRFPGSDRTQVLLGEVDGRYVVGADTRGQTQFWSVARDGSARRLGAPQTYYNSGPMMGAGRILVSDSDRGTGLTRMSVLDARTGSTLLSRKGSLLIPLSIGRRGLVYSIGGTSNAVRLWGPDGSDRPLFTSGSMLLVPHYVGLDRGLVVNEDIDHDVYRLAFTDLSHPRASRWSTPEGNLLGISPSGRYAVIQPPTADGTNSQRALEVRRMSDGALVRHISLTHYLGWTEAAFEDEDTFVVPVEAGHRRQVLVRCQVTGTCERASDPASLIRLVAAGEL